MPVIFLLRYVLSCFLVFPKIAYYQIPYINQEMDLTSENKPVNLFCYRNNHLETYL